MLDFSENRETYPSVAKAKDRLLEQFEFLSARIHSTDDREAAASLYEELIGILQKIEDFTLENGLFHKYDLEIRPGGLVSFRVPAEASFRGLFLECNEYSMQRWGRPAVDDSVLIQGSDLPFGLHLTTEIVGLVPRSLRLSRAEQGMLVSAGGMLVPTLESTAAAAALYFCRTGKDLFRGYWVRTAGGPLVFDEGGVEYDPDVPECGPSNSVGCAGTPCLR